MTSAELLLQDYDMEIAMTRRILQSIPEGNPGFKCHDKSMPLGKLAMHVATLPIFGKTILTTPFMDMKDPTNKGPDQTFTTRDAALGAFDANAADCRAALAACSDADLAAAWKFSFRDHVISNSPRSLA